MRDGHARETRCNTTASVCLRHDAKQTCMRGARRGMHSPTSTVGSISCAFLRVTRIDGGFCISRNLAASVTLRRGMVDRRWTTAWVPSNLRGGAAVASRRVCAIDSRKCCSAHRRQGLMTTATVLWQPALHEKQMALTTPTRSRWDACWLVMVRPPTCVCVSRMPKGAWLSAVKLKTFVRGPSRHESKDSNSHHRVG